MPDNSQDLIVALILGERSYVHIDTYLPHKVTAVAQQVAGWEGTGKDRRSLSKAC